MKRLLLSITCIYCTVITSFAALVAHWPFDEGAGTIAQDVSGFGHHGQLINGVQWGGDETRHSFVSFSKNEDRISTPVTYALTKNNGFTWAFWLYNNEEIADPDGFILGNRDPEYPSGLNKYVFFKINLVRVAMAANAKGSEQIGKFDLLNIPYQNWHFYVLVKNGINWTSYRDGIPLNEVEWNFDVPTYQFPFSIGGEVRDSKKMPFEGFNGYIDDVYLFDHALNDAEATALYEKSVNQTKNDDTLLVNLDTRTISGSSPKNEPKNEVKNEPKNEVKNESGKTKILVGVILLAIVILIPVIGIIARKVNNQRS